MFANVYNLSVELRFELSKVVVSQRLPKGAFLLRAPNTCTRLYFITKGLARGYYFEGSEEITSWFAKENDFVLSVESFFEQVSSYEYIELLEDSELLYIECDVLRDLYERSFELNYASRTIFQQLAVIYIKRVNSLTHKSAKQKLELFEKEQNEVYRRAPLKYIASYLGLRPETLSRIRARKIK